MLKSGGCEPMPVILNSLRIAQGFLKKREGKGVGGILVMFKSGGCEPMPVMILDGAGVLPKINNCARLQVDGFAKEVRRATDQDLDQEGVTDLYVVH